MKKGYVNTGISDILQATSLPKGSFYFHFKSKKELGLEVASYYNNQLIDWLNSILLNSLDKNSFVRTIVSDIRIRYRNGTYYGCPFSSFGTEAAVVEPEITAILSQDMRHLLTIFAAGLSGIPIGSLSATELQIGEHALALYEGYLVAFRIIWNEKILDAMEEGLLSL